MLCRRMQDSVASARALSVPPPHDGAPYRRNSGCAGGPPPPGRTGSSYGRSGGGETRSRFVNAAMCAALPRASYVRPDGAFCTGRRRVPVRGAACSGHVV